MDLQENIHRIKEVMGIINEEYTTWVKRRMDMIRKAERETSNYMTHKFKQNPQQFRKNQFIDIFFSTMMDELHGELSDWGTQDFDYSKVHKEIRDSFRDYVEKLWEHLNKESITEGITKSERETLDFFDLVDKGILWVTQPYENGKRVKPNWVADSNIVTLWNIKHPEIGQEWVLSAINHPKPEAIQWWNDKGQFTLSDAKYNQIIRSIKMSEPRYREEQTESELTERCWKGYTQKGMKTMFGKKYPNCVKSKK